MKELRDKLARAVARFRNRALYGAFVALAGHAFQAKEEREKLLVALRRSRTASCG